MKEEYSSDVEQFVRGSPESRRCGRGTECKPEEQREESLRERQPGYGSDCRWPCRPWRASPVVLVVKNLPVDVGDISQLNLPMWVLFLGWEDPLEEGMATHSSILAWRIL